MHIFELFYRIDKSRTIKTGGARFSLAIANDIVKFHSGEITVKSRLDKETTFEIQIPLVEEK